MPMQGEFYQRDRDRHPPARDPKYKTSVARSPQYSLISLENTVSEITGPVWTRLLGCLGAGRARAVPGGAPAR